jgi:hypothetical protein
MEIYKQKYEINTYFFCIEGVHERGAFVGGIVSHKQYCCNFSYREYI